MPPFVKTKADEGLWAKAKAGAEKQGHAGDWPFVTGIYKRMKSGKVAAEMKMKTAAYPDEFMRVVENIQFRQPTTGNQVKFVSLTDEEKARVYARWQKMQQKAEGQKPKKPKRPTFSKARDAAFDALEEDGWSLKKHLKTPKAEREIDGEQVILHFKPQAVWMEVKGKVPARSLHTDIRDVDPKQWASTLAKEAQGMLKLEESMKFGRTENHMKITTSAIKTTRWRDLSPQERKARMHKAFGGMMPEEAEEILLPSDVKRVSAERLRDLGRSLMVAGMRPPRPQMVSIAVTLDGLLEQLKMLGDQNPSLNALRRRILLQLRGKILGPG